MIQKIAIFCNIELFIIIFPNFQLVVIYILCKTSGGIMFEFALIAAVVFTAIAFIKKSKYLFLKSIPYIIYIHLFLLFFEQESLILKVIIFSVLLIFSAIIVLYQENSKDKVQFDGNKINEGSQ